MKTILNYFALLVCLAVIALCTGCAGQINWACPSSPTYYASEPSYTLQGFTPDGVAIMGWTTYYNQSDKYVQSGLVQTAPYNVCGPTTVPSYGGPVIYSGTVIGGWHGDQYSGKYMGGNGRNVYRTGPVTGNNRSY